MSLQQAWLRRGALAWSLLPAAWLYALLAGARRALYRLGLLQTQRAPVPVIVVGNVIAGGAGKTPVVTAVVEHLKARGLQPGVISRGYGRRGSGCVEVTQGSLAAECGDEPLLIARRCRVPVFVASQRIDAARALLRAHPRTQVLVCDDGLQHLPLARDLEICVFDVRGVGNGWQLPAGPLREPWPRPVDFVLRPRGIPGLDGFSVDRRLADHAVRADGTRRLLADFAGASVLAVAGIARPEAFFSMLEAAGLRPARILALPDHHDFDAHPVDVPAGMTLVCTEKDAVKLWTHHPDAWAVPLSVAIDPAFWSALDPRVDALVATLSSTDGPQTS